jgi:hypothetical protein
MLRQVRNERRHAQKQVERIDAAIAALSGANAKRTENSGSRRLSQPPEEELLLLSARDGRKLGR